MRITLHVKYKSTTHPNQHPFLKTRWKNLHPLASLMASTPTPHISLHMYHKHLLRSQLKSLPHHTTHTTIPSHSQSPETITHFPIILHTPPDFLIHKAPRQSPSNHMPRLLNPIPEDTLHALKTKFNHIAHNDTLILTNLQNFCPRNCGKVPNSNYINSPTSLASALKLRALKNHFPSTL